MIGFDSPEAIAASIIDFSKTRYVQGEYVRIDINAEVRYWGEILSASYAQKEDGTDASEYKVSLASDPKGIVIGEASFVGIPPFLRIKHVPSKMLMKKFIRSCATRNLFPGAPWIVNVQISHRLSYFYLLGRVCENVWTR